MTPWLSASWLLGCGVPEAEQGSTVVLSGTDVAPLSDAVLERDGIGELFEIEAAIFDRDDQLAPGVRVLLTVGWDGASLHPVHGDPQLVRWVKVGPAESEVGLPACGLDDVEPSCTFLDTKTDADGVARAVLFVDVLPDSGANIPVFASAGGDLASVEIEFEETTVVQ